MDNTVIVLGIGGIGCRIGVDFAAKLKAARNTRVLCLAADTDASELARLNAGQDVLTMTMSDSMSIKQVTERLGAHTLSEWFPTADTDGMAGSVDAANMASGSGGCRSKALLLLDNYLCGETIPEKLFHAVDSFLVGDGAVPAGELPPAALYVAAGLGGGTGSGLFIALTRLLERHIRQSCGIAVSSSVYLAVPDESADGNPVRSFSNAGAAMDELDAIMTGRPRMDGHNVRVGQENDPRIGVLADSGSGRDRVFNAVTLLYSLPGGRGQAACVQTWSEIMLMDAVGITSPASAAEGTDGLYRTVSFNKLHYTPEQLCASFAGRLASRKMDTWNQFAEAERKAWGSFRLLHPNMKMTGYRESVGTLAEQFGVFDSDGTRMEAFDDALKEALYGIIGAQWLDDAIQAARPSVPEAGKHEFGFARRERRKRNRDAVRKLAEAGDGLVRKYAAQCLERLNTAVNGADSGRILRTVILDGLCRKDGLFPHPAAAFADMCEMSAMIALRLRNEYETAIDRACLCKSQLLIENDYTAKTGYGGAGFRLRGLKHAGNAWPQELLKNTAQYLPRLREDDYPAVAGAVAHLQRTVSERAANLWYGRIYEVLTAEIARVRGIMERLPASFAAFRTDTPFDVARGMGVGLEPERQNALFSECCAQMDADTESGRMLDDLLFRRLFAPEAQPDSANLRDGLEAWIEQTEAVCRAQAWLSREKQKNVISVVRDSAPMQLGSLLAAVPAVPYRAVTAEEAEIGCRKPETVSLRMSPASAEALCGMTEEETLSRALRAVGVYEPSGEANADVPDSAVYTVRMSEQLCLGELPGFSADGRIMSCLRTACDNVTRFRTRLWNPYLAYFEREESVN